MNRKAAWFRILVASSLVTMFGCKDESAPKPDNPSAPLPQQPSYNPVSPDPDPSNQTPDDKKTDDSDCSNSTNPEFTTTSGNPISFTTNSTVSITFKAKADNDCDFEVYHVDESNLPQGVTVAQDYSDSVELTGQAFSGNVTSGSITVYARNLTTCIKENSRSDCTDYSKSKDSDLSQFSTSESISWNMNGTGNNNSNSKNVTNTLLLGAGMGLFRSLVGGVDPISAMLGGVTGAITGGGMIGTVNSGFIGIGGQSNCTNYFNQQQCQAGGCYWDYSYNRCSYSQNNALNQTQGVCSRYYNQYNCQSAGCYWNTSINACSQSNSLGGLGQQQCQNYYNQTIDLRIINPIIYSKKFIGA
jgi:hypothetical protein